MSECKTCGGRGKIQAGYAGEELEPCPDFKDSSLGKWFPFTAKELEELKALNADKFRTIEAYCKAASSDKWKIKTLVDAIDRYLSATGYSANANILTDARDEVLSLKP